MVKANAYGHGIERVWSALRGATDGFAIFSLAEEAITLRERGWKRADINAGGFSMPKTRRRMALSADHLHPQ